MIRDDKGVEWQQGGSSDEVLRCRKALPIVIRWDRRNTMAVDSDVLVRYSIQSNVQRYKRGIFGE